MITDTCSMHCGRFTGVDKDAYAKFADGLETLFGLVEYDEESRSLQLCGARGVRDMPNDLAQIFDLLARLLDDDGRGRIMINCEGVMEICYFRRGMWKLEAVPLPPDPFEGVRHVS